jgi:ankyrin repeat protein
MSGLARVIVSSFAMGVLACRGTVPDFSPMARAARAGNVRAIKGMIAAGQSPDIIDRGGNHWTPLLHAIHKGQRPAVDALLAASANVHRGGGPPSLADRLTSPTPLMMAVGNGQADIVRTLLAAGADPRADGPGIFTLAVAGGALTDIENPLLGRCNAEVVRVLLRHDPTLRVPRNVRGRLSLLFARFNNCEEVLRLVHVG